MAKLCTQTLVVFFLIGLALIRSANGAIVVTYDLRLQSTNAKIVEINTPNQVITFDVVAQITNNDGNHTNDGIAGCSLRFTSVEDTFLPLLGNYSAATRQVSFSHGEDGTPAPGNGFDSNSDVEWGNISATSTIGNFNPISLVMISGSGVSTGVTEILLGTIVWTGPISLTPSSYTDLNVAYFKNVATSKGAFTIQSDGVVTSNAIADSFEAVGLPVHLVVVPEPAAVAIFGLGTIILLSRRR